MKKLSFAISIMAVLLSFAGCQGITESSFIDPPVIYPHDPEIPVTPGIQVAQNQVAPGSALNFKLISNIWHADGTFWSVSYRPHPLVIYTEVGEARAFDELSIIFRDEGTYRVSVYNPADKKTYSTIMDVQNEYEWYGDPISVEAITVPQQ